MSEYQFLWYGEKDPGHFTYTGAGTQNIMGKDVVAFQMLWNCNNPDDKIELTGEYDTPTRLRVLKSPIRGFPKLCPLK